MTRSPLVSLWVMAAVFGAGSAVAEEPASPAKQTPVVATPSSPAPALPPLTQRALSPTAAAKLNAAVPKFDATATTTTPSIEPGTDLREIDKPRNTIIRLPSYIVLEEKPVVLKERDVVTRSARRENALNKYPGLRLGSFWIFRNDGIAMFMQQEEERLEQKRDFEDLVSLTRFSDPATHATAKRGVDDTFTRKADFGR